METKLPTYCKTSFSRICLGMTINQDSSFIVVNVQVHSLYSLMADGQYRNTPLGRDTWRSLILVLRPPYIYIVTKKGLILSQSTHTRRIKLPKQESVLSPTTPITTMMSISESGWVQEGRMMTLTRVESW